MTDRGSRQEDLGGAFRVLEPPPGGRSSLRRRLAKGAPAAPRGRLRLATATASIPLAALLVWALAQRRPGSDLDYPDSTRPLRMSLGLLAEATPGAGPTTSASSTQLITALPVERPGVALYLVGSAPPASDRAE